MKTAKVLTAALVAGGAILGAQQAMAYGNLGDFYVRGNYIKTAPLSHAKNSHSWAAALGWKFTDKFGVEFNAPWQKQNFHSRFGGKSVNAKYEAYTLLGQYYPLGGDASQVQPYIGVGATYFDVTHRGQLHNGINGKLESSIWSPTAQVGLDYYLTSWLAANVNVQYSPNKMKGNFGYNRYFNPLRVGAGLTFRF
ncbi:hypothetical protein LMG33818_001255 [Halomonadaceae bacterium LMG 33818]|uniref:OmpW/AlkL family protein n=1 Tax=Cernens ardua TaxID=3402176 RepID=UPI003EDC916A